VERPRRFATCEYCGFTASTLSGENEGTCDAPLDECIHANEVVGVIWVTDSEGVNE